MEFPFSKVWWAGLGFSKAERGVGWIFEGVAGGCVEFRGHRCGWAVSFLLDTGVFE